MADRRTWLRLALGGALGAGAAGLLYWTGRAGQPDDGPRWQAASAALLASAYPDLDGRPQPLSQWKGRVLVVNFWATWCPPCLREIPGFVDLQEKYRDRGVIFVGIAVDKKEAVQDFARRMPVNYPLLVGGMESAAFARRIGNGKGALPFTAVLDRGGRLSHLQDGYFEAHHLEKILGALI
jgi:thiol-disulfide isomerase/thioredoxin